MSTGHESSDYVPSAAQLLLDEVRLSNGLPAPPLAREIRRAAGVSRARLARELSVHPITVARWERGTRRPRGEIRLAYARLLADLSAEVSR